MKEALQAFIKLLYISLLLIGSIHALTAKHATHATVTSVYVDSIDTQQLLDTYLADTFGNSTHHTLYTFEKLYQDAL